MLLVLALARERGVQFVGKTNLGELGPRRLGRERLLRHAHQSRASPAALVPGGSSSGSAVAVATGRSGCCAGHRHRRLDPNSRGVLRRGGIENHVRTRAIDGSGSSRASASGHRRSPRKGHSAPRAGHGHAPLGILDYYHRAAPGNPQRATSRSGGSTCAGRTPPSTRPWTLRCGRRGLSRGATQRRFRGQMGAGAGRWQAGGGGRVVDHRP